jgi:acyl dehydratase
MSLDPKYIGKKYGPYTYEIGLEKMREFAYAIAGGVPSSCFQASVPHGLNLLLHDAKAGRESPYKSVIAFPTFCVTFAMKPFAEAVTDPDLDINLVMLVHGEQDFEFFDVMRPGDTMTSVGTITQIYEKAGKDFLVLITESKNQKDKLVVRGTWTAVIRR